VRQANGNSSLSLLFHCSAWCFTSILRYILDTVRSNTLSRVARLFFVQHTKTGKMCQMTMKFTKWL
jgi:hypothetical protein